MRKTRSDKGVSRIDVSQRNLTQKQKQQLINDLTQKMFDKKTSSGYKAYLGRYIKNIKEGYTMERLLSEKDFKNIKKQSIAQGMKYSANIAAAQGKLQLTNSETAAMISALENLEKEMAKEGQPKDPNDPNSPLYSFEDMDQDTRKRLKKYFKMNEAERIAYLQGTESELFRYDVFNGYASMGRYYRQNSPD
jgi:hypothetical protein